MIAVPSAGPTSPPTPAAAGRRAAVMATATNLDGSESARIETPRARRGGFGFTGGSPCRICGRHFSSTKARRRHERRAHERSVPVGRNPNVSNLSGDIGEFPDPLDSPKLKGDALREAVKRRLRYLSGQSEAR
jgi:hypothetical protein